MKIILNNIEPFSINKAYYKGTFNRTKELREWSDRIINQMATPVNQAIIKEYKKLLKDKAIGMRIYFFIPHKNFYTKDGSISIRSKDLSNIEKNLIDLIFGSKYNVMGLDIDDKNIVDLYSSKRVSSSFKIEIKLKIIKLPEIKK